VKRKDCEKIEIIILIDFSIMNTSFYLHHNPIFYTKIFSISSLTHAIFNIHLNININITGMNISIQKIFKPSNTAC